MDLCGLPGALPIDHVGSRDLERHTGDQVAYEEDQIPPAPEKGGHQKVAATGSCVGMCAHSPRGVGIVIKLEGGPDSLVDRLSARKLCVPMEQGE
jgi:hypothetical protein